MRIHSAVSTLLLGVVMLASGCNDKSVGQAGCEDLVHALGGVAARCGYDRAVNEQAAETNATGGRGCEAVVSLRDQQAFYDSCLPGSRV